ncbi:uncharacterized protein C8Q71DRAFT_719346 [Rhodofomes roseus]|uniref:Uncharacterized protein n=1 Tax=Rhodofomes roseus TaxID=34475 RepID=A0ABQ8KYB5_9APHY|nr:uncharacterized protein C8Q71DRAFT_719346 [Rhodofomes roseus]KAH9843590.1 hypothetical protein C8Q71DRAFT_719346 [Rhodofomes roseus]
MSKHNVELHKSLDRKFAASTGRDLSPLHDGLDSESRRCNACVVPLGRSPSGRCHCCAVVEVHMATRQNYPIGQMIVQAIMQIAPDSDAALVFSSVLKTLNPVRELVRCSVQSGMGLAVSTGELQGAHQGTAVVGIASIERGSDINDRGIVIQDHVAAKEDVSLDLQQPSSNRLGLLCHYVLSDLTGAQRIFAASICPSLVLFALKCHEIEDISIRLHDPARTARTQSFTRPPRPSQWRRRRVHRVSTSPLEHPPALISKCTQLIPYPKRRRLQSAPGCMEKSASTVLMEVDVVHVGGCGVDASTLHDLRHDLLDTGTSQRTGALQTELAKVKELPHGQACNRSNRTVPVFPGPRVQTTTARAPPDLALQRDQIFDTYFGERVLDPGKTVDDVEVGEQSKLATSPEVVRKGWGQLYRTGASAKF